MNIQEFRDYCISKPGVTEEFPFGPEALVFKVGGKMFTLTGIEDFANINLKCKPEKVPDRIENYSAVQPGYHMNKKHWITILMDGTIPDKTIREWVDESYELVFSSLPENVKSRITRSN